MSQGFCRGIAAGFALPGLLIGCKGIEPVSPDLEEGRFRTFELPGGATIEMSWIEPGSFRMGRPNAPEDTVRLQHEVTISQGFRLMQSGPR